MSTTTTGFATQLITFSRGSLATVTDADGKIKWAPHNLLSASEQFDAWGKYLTTVTANSTVAPNGTTTADTIATTSANATIYQNSVIPAGTNTFSCWFKAGTLTTVKVIFDGGSSTGREATFTLTGSGTAGAVANSSGGGGTLSGGTSSITPLADGWYLCTIAGVTGTATAALTILLASSGNVIAWGAHLYRSDLGGMQANASAYPMYNPSTPRNLLGWSEAFDNAAWTSFAFAATVSANAIAAPNGSRTADAVNGDGTANVHYISQAITLSSSGVYTLSVYAKANGVNFLQFFTNGAGSTGQANFDITNGAGSVGTSAAPFSSLAISSVGNGWYRCSAVISAQAATNIYIGLSNSASASRAPSFTTSSGIYVWGAQLSDSASLDPYVGSYGPAPSAAAAHGPRLDYDPVTLAARGLLVEEQRTNICQYSEDFTSWTAVGTTVSANSVVAPSGNSTADRVTFGGSVADRIQNLCGTAVNGQTVTFSLWMKGSGTISINVGTSTGVGGEGESVITLSSTWTRYSVSVTYSSPTGDRRVMVIYRSGNTATVVDMWGAQLETNASFATSYIPNVNTAMGVQRLADVASVATSQFPYSASASSLVVAFDVLGASGGNNILQLAQAASPNGLLFYQSASLLRLNAYVDASSVNIGDMTVNTVQKAAIGYDGSSNGAVRNGGTVSSVGTTVSAAATELSIGSAFNDSAPMNGHIRQITYIPRRLSNAELQARTA